LRFLAPVEKARLGRFHFLLAADDLAEIFHPPGIGGSPRHRLDPVQHLQSEENNESQSEPWMHQAAQRAASEDGSEPPEKPKEGNAETSEHRQEKQECDHPMQEARAHAMTQ
jgi:hypothetical protein